MSSKTPLPMSEFVRISVKPPPTLTSDVLCEWPLKQNNGDKYTTIAREILTSYITVSYKSTNYHSILQVVYMLGKIITINH